MVTDGTILLLEAFSRGKQSLGVDYTKESTQIMNLKT